MDSLSAENLGDLSLIEVADILKQVRSELELADAVPYEEMPQSAHGAARRVTKQDTFFAGQSARPQRSILIAHFFKKVDQVIENRGETQS